MCGIAGLLLHDPREPNVQVVSAMSKAMHYRGPDDGGIYLAAHIGLVHRRLRVRDLSNAGSCPMGSSDGLVQVIFNGEIYNWRELRQELELGEIIFKSQSDTEVILHGYLTWGSELFKRLRGMFAIAIWDARAGRLLLARDRAGEKPLFYHSSADQFLFGSTTEALAPAQARRTIDPVGLGAYLAHSFIPASHTIWEGVQVLPPAHLLIIEPGGKPRVERYWDLPRRAPKKMSLVDCEAATETLVADCVARCLDADAPVGVFLSGGVDSSLVAALAARRQPGLPAFSAGFAETQYDELPYARQVATHLGLSHHTIEITVDDVIEALPHLVCQFGQPFGDSSSVPSYLLARLARQHVTVCLGGDGGDESFGGYWRTQAGVYSARFGAIVPEPVRKHVIPVLTKPLGSVGRRINAMNKLSLQPIGAGYANAESWLNHMAAIAGPALQSCKDANLKAMRVGMGVDRAEASVMQRLLFDDFQVQLPDAFLTKVDVASMAASLEVRSPLLDQAILEMAWLLPDATKLRLGQRKWLLKRIAARHVPASVIYRPKMGFAMPLANWFRGKLGDMLEDLLNGSVAVSRGWLKADAAHQALREHQGGVDHSTRLWLILWLELWFCYVAADEQPAQRMCAV